MANSSPSGRVTRSMTKPERQLGMIYNKLVPELKLEVWNQASSVPRMLIIQLRSCRCGGDFHFTLDGNNISPPKELQTCFMSRQIASKKYQPLFATSMVDDRVYSHHEPPSTTRLDNPHPKVPISSVDTLYIVHADDDQNFQTKLRLFPHDISTQLLHYVAFDAELLHSHPTRRFIWCFVWACSLQEVVLVQRSSHPTRTNEQDKFDFVNIAESEVDSKIREKLEKFIKDQVSTPPPKAMFEKYFGKEIKPRDVAAFKAPTFKFMGLTKGGQKL
jgi:hypothetical protein